MVHRLPQLFLLFLSKLGPYSALRTPYSLSRFYQQLWGLTSAGMSAVLAAAEIAAIPGGFVGPLGDYLGFRASSAILQFLMGLSVFLLVVIPLFPNNVNNNNLSNMTYNAINGTSIEPAWYSLLLILRIVFGFGLAASSMMLQSAAITILASKEKDDVGKITGILETSWSLSLLVLLPPLSVGYENLGPNSVWIILGAIILLPLPGLLISLPPISPAQAAALNQSSNAQEVTPGEKESFFREYFRVLCIWDSSTLYLLSHIIFNIAHNMMLTSFTYWIVDFYFYNPVQIGQVTLILTSAELSGVLIATFFGDRIGLKRAVLFSTLSFTIVSLVHSFLTRISVGLGLGSLFLLFIFGEMSFVTRIGFADAMVKESDRTVYLGIFFQAQFAGRAIGAVLAEALWGSVPTSEDRENSMQHVVVGIGSFLLALLSFGIIIRVQPIGSQPDVLEDQEISEANDAPTLEMTEA